MAQCKEKPKGDKYGFTYFARMMNEGKGVAPLASDSRRRPDRAALEVGGLPMCTTPYCMHLAASPAFAQRPAHLGSRPVLQVPGVGAAALQLRSLMQSRLCSAETCEVALQWGDTGTAGAEKHSLEEKQRAERKVRLRWRACCKCVGPLICCATWSDVHIQAK